MATSTYNYKRVYVWELPVRFFHWITAISTAILIVTGFLIADPPAINTNLEATNSYWFGVIRVIHFIVAYILIANLIFRIYWSIAGNQFAKWDNFIPYTKEGLKNILYVLKVDIFLMKDKKHKLSNISIGHNYLAAFSYFIMTLFFLLQVATGLALISTTSSWWFTDIFGTITSWFGSEHVVRYVHHILTWLFMAFIVVHVYLVLFHDYVEARGETSAMISGFKFIRSERIEETEKEVIGKVTKQMWKGDKNGGGSKK